VQSCSANNVQTSFCAPKCSPQDFEKLPMKLCPRKPHNVDYDSLSAWNISLYYIHHENLLALERSKDHCHFCLKLSNGSAAYCRPMRLQPSSHAAIVLYMVLKDTEYIGHKGETQQLLDECGIFHVVCGESGCKYPGTKTDRSTFCTRMSFLF
jgi:hypothetical protein